MPALPGIPRIPQSVHGLPILTLISVYVDDIKAIHSTTDARHYREQFQISSAYEPMWLTVVYTSGSKLKALHLVSSTVQEHELWYKTLKKLRQYRKEVTGGLAFLMSPERKLNPEKSVRVIRRHWKEAGGIGTETAEVGFPEVERLCWKLNVHLSSKYLRQKFDVCFLVLRLWLMN
jgi:phosphatidylinositol phospholipase C, delta